MFQVITDFPIAYDSPDHITPFGVMHNNNHNQDFNEKIYAIFGRPIFLMDLGCAGGHSVYQFNRQGHYACGLEGSDYRKIRNMPEWDKEPNLFTCDVSKPYTVTWNGQPALFDVITAWELIEHIKESDLPTFLNNVKKHLVDGGLFIGSICVFDWEKRKATEGIEWGPGMHHQTIYPREWWYEYLEDWIWEWDLQRSFGNAFVRGPGIMCDERYTINFVLRAAFQKPTAFLKDNK